MRPRQRTSVTVILIDRINSRDIDQMVVRKQVVAFLEQADATDRVALYMLESSRIRVLHDRLAANPAQVAWHHP